MVEEGILKPEFIAPRQEGFPETVIVCFHPRFVEALGKKVKLTEIGHIFAGCSFTIYGFDWEGRKLGIYVTCQGSPASAVFLEEVISRGARRFIFFGTCGSLDSKLTHAKVIVPTRAFRDEGVSAHYGATEPWQPIPSADRLIQALSTLGVPFVSGPIWTTDAPYRETPSKIKSLKEQGAIAVEMECASLMAVAAFRHIELYQFIFPADKLDGPEWDKGTCPLGERNPGLS